MTQMATPMYAVRHEMKYCASRHEMKYWQTLGGPVVVVEKEHGMSSLIFWGAGRIVYRRD